MLAWVARSMYRTWQEAQLDWRRKTRGHPRINLGSIAVTRMPLTCATCGAETSPTGTIMNTRLSDQATLRAFIAKHGAQCSPCAHRFTDELVARRKLTGDDLTAAFARTQGNMRQLVDDGRGDPLPFLQSCGADRG